MLRSDRLPSIRTAAAPRADSDIGWLGALLRALLCVGLGTAIGLALTARAVKHGTDFGIVRVGGWSFRPTAGTPDIDPYLRAHYAHIGQIPMDASVGAMFVADRDGRGVPLRRDCDYRVTGVVPQARFWTLEAADGKGTPLATVPERSGILSTALLRDAAGGFVIDLARKPQPGNWVPTGGSGQLLLVLRLYDTAVAALGSRALRQLPMPVIAVGSCA